MLETPLGWAVLFVLGICTGTLSGILGIGGGLIITPVLTMFNVPLVQASATSLVGVLLSSVSGSIRNLNASELNWRVSLLLALFGIFTAQVGAWLGDRIPDAILSLAFAGLLVTTIYLIRLKQQLKQKQSANLEINPDVKPDLTGHAAELPTQSSQQNYPMVSIGGIGLLAGILSGLFGVGGGVVMVPLQMLFLGEEIKSAVRTSLGAIVAIAISALAQHAWNNNVLWIPGICIGLGGILGAQLGSRLLPRLSNKLVNQLFRLFLIGLAVYMIMRAIAGWK